MAREAQRGLGCDRPRAPGFNEHSWHRCTSRYDQDVPFAKKVDAGGNRHEVSKEEIAGLVGKNEVSEIEDALEEAFEAGIRSLLDPKDEVEERPETEDELALRRELLTLVIGAGVRRRLQRRIVQRVVLSRAATR
jgi:hypothetical protein